MNEEHAKQLAQRILPGAYTYISEEDRLFCVFWNTHFYEVCRTHNRVALVAGLCDLCASWEEREMTTELVADSDKQRVNCR